MTGLWGRKEGGCSAESGVEMATGTAEQGPYRGQPGAQGFGDLKIPASPIC